MKKNILIGVISLGCDKNRVDTETMLTILRDAGFDFTPNANEADIIIINTCCFIKSARNESEDTIAEMIAYKTKGKCKKLIVTGCLPQYDMKSLKIEFPEVDAFIGTNEYKNIVEIVDKLLESSAKIRNNSSPYCLDFVKNRMVTTPSYYAYLKIADGCNNFCTFCTIPNIRGRYRSRELKGLVAEAKDLVKHGAKELILVAQDITKYGVDLYGKPCLIELLKQLSLIDGLVWIRLLYCYPEMVTDDLINEISNNPKICDYLDVPFQHVSSKLLKAMNRSINKEQTLELAKKIKSNNKMIAIRTTFMVGFPGETKDDFKQLCDFVKETHMVNVGFFAYSREEGTPAFNMDDQIDDSIKNKRLIKLVKLQKAVHNKNCKRYFVNKVLSVLCEGFDPELGMYFGRTQYQAPEIDTVTYFRSNDQVEVGSFCDVKILKVRDYDLEGEKI